MPFNQSMTVPLELKLLGTAEGPRLTFTPVNELKALRTRTHTFPGTDLVPGREHPLSEVRAELVEIRAEFEPGDATEIRFNVRGATVVYETKTQELVVNGHRAPAPCRDGRQRLVLYGDRTGLEIFASDGLTYVPMSFQPRAEDLSLGLSAKGGPARLIHLEVHELRSAWPDLAQAGAQAGAP